MKCCNSKPVSTVMTLSIAAATALLTILLQRGDGPGAGLPFRQLAIIISAAVVCGAVVYGISKLALRR